MRGNIRIVASSVGGKCCPAFSEILDENGNFNVPEGFGHWGCLCTIDVNVEEIPALSENENTRSQAGQETLGALLLAAAASGGGGYTKGGGIGRSASGSGSQARQPGDAGNTSLQPQAPPAAPVSSGSNGGGGFTRGGGHGRVENQVVTSNLGNVYDVTQSNNHFITTKNPGLAGEANSSVDILDSAGNITTRRWYGPDGEQIRDVDFTNHGNPKMHPEWPHEHNEPRNSLKNK